MAVTQKDLLFEISVDTSNTVKNMDSLDKSIMALGKTIETLSYSFQRIELELKNISTQLEVLSKISTGTNKSLSKTISTTGQTVKTTSDSVKNYTSEVIVNNGAVSDSIATQDQFNNVISRTFNLVAAGVVGFSAISYKLQLFDEIVAKTTGKFYNFATILQKTTTVLGKSFHLSLLSAFETIALVSPALLLLGSMLKKSDSETVRFIGTLTTFAGLIMGGVAGAVLYLTNILGGFIEKIGLGLMESMAAAQESFIKFQATMSQFTFTVKGFTKVFGTETIGSMRFWQDTLDKIYETTIYSREELAKSIKLFIAEGRVIGMTAEDNAKLLQRSADIASATGNSLYDVSQMIINALTNNANAVLGLGIDVRDSSLEHAKYAEAMGVTLEQMNAQELAMVRLKALYEKTIPIIGSAATQTETWAGANAMYEKSLKDMEIKLGNTGYLTRKYLVAVTKIIQFFAEIPAPIISFIGTMRDLAGVILVVFGQLLKLSALILSFVLALKIGIFTLNQFFGLSLSLLGVLQNMYRWFILIPIVVISLSKAFEELIASSEGFSETIHSIGKNLGLISETSDEATKSIGLFSKLATSAFNLLKMSLIGLAEVINYVAKAILIIKQKFSNKDDEVVYSEMIFELDKRLASLDKTATDTAKGITFFGTNVAFAADALQKNSSQIKANENLAEAFKNRVIKAAAEINKGYDPVIEKQKVLGNEFEKAIATAKQAKEELDNIFKLKLNEKESAQKYADSERALNQATLEIEKLRLDTLQKITDQRRQMEAEVLKTKGRNIEAIKIETTESLRQIDRQIEGLKSLGDLRKDEILDLERTKALIISIGENKIDEERAKFAEKLLSVQQLISNIRADGAEAEKDELRILRDKMASRDTEITKLERQYKASNDLTKSMQTMLGIARQTVKETEKTGIDNLKKKNLDELIKANDELSKNIKSANYNQYEVANRQYQLEMKILNDKYKYLESNGLITEEYEKQYEIRKKLLAQQLNDEGGSKSTKQYQGMLAAGAKVASSITGVFTKGTMGMVAGAGSVVLMIVQAITGLVDSLKGLLSGLTDFFTNLTELPNLLPQMIAKMGDAVVKFTSEFGPNLVSKIPEIVATIVDKFFGQIGDANGKFFENMMTALTSFMDRIPEVLQKAIVSVIRGTAATIAPSIKYTLVAFFREIPAIIKTIIKDVIPAIVNGIVEGISEGLKEFSKLDWNILGKGGKSIQKDGEKLGVALTDAMKKGIQTLTGESAKIFSVTDLTGLEKALSPAEEMAKKLEDALKNGTDYLKKWWNELLKALKDVWMWIWQELQKAWAWLDSIWKSVWSQLEQWWSKLVEIWQNVWSQIEQWWSKLSDIWQSVWAQLEQWWSKLSDIWQSVWTKLQEFWDGLKDIWNNVWTKLSEAWQSMKDAWQSVWDTLSSWFDKLGTIGQTIWDGLKSAFSMDTIQSWGTKIWDGLSASISTAGTSFSNLGANIWDGFKTALSSAKEGFSSFGSKIWDGFTASLTSAKESFSSWGTKIWSGFKSSFSNVGSGLVKIIEDAFSGLDLGNFASRMFAVDMGGTGTVEKALGIDIPFMSFAQGGQVPGMAAVPGDSALNDRILALLSPGEAIIPRSLMDQPAIRSIVQAIINGTIKPAQYWKASVNIGGTQVGVTDKGVQVGDYKISVEDLWKPFSDSWNMVRDKTYDMILKMFESNKFHTGGFVPAFANGGDVPSLLQPGEFVVNRDAAQSLGTGFLNNLNNRTTQTAQGQQPVINVKIDIKTTEPIDDVFFRQRVWPKVQNELKKSSLNGEFIISAKGIRT
jgi:phage-related protein